MLPEAPVLRLSSPLAAILKQLTDEFHTSRRTLPRYQLLINKKKYFFILSRFEIHKSFILPDNAHLCDDLSHFNKLYFYLVFNISQFYIHYLNFCQI